MNGFMPGASLLVKVGQERQEQAVADLWLVQMILAGGNLHLLGIADLPEVG
jgi:hypothetical protein